MPWVMFGSFNKGYERAGTAMKTNTAEDAEDAEF